MYTACTGCVRWVGCVTAEAALGHVVLDDQGWSTTGRAVVAAVEADEIGRDVVVVIQLEAQPAPARPLHSAS